MGKFYSIPPSRVIDTALYAGGSMFVGEGARERVYEDCRFVTALQPWQWPPDDNNFIGAICGNRVYVDFELPPNAMEMRDEQGRLLLVTTLGGE